MLYIQFEVYNGAGLHGSKTTLFPCPSAHSYWAELSEQSYKHTKASKFAMDLRIAEMNFLAMDKIFCLRQKNFVPDKFDFV